MIAIDTNLLVYAHRRDSEWHQEALHLLSELAGGRQLWAIPCRQNGVAELWSADRDLTRFEKIKVRNPLVRPRRG